MGVQYYFMGDTVLFYGDYSIILWGLQYYFNAHGTCICSKIEEEKLNFSAR